MTPRYLGIIVGTFLALPAATAAQQSPDATGQRVRVTLVDGRKVSGTLLPASKGQVTFVDEVNGGRHTLSVDVIERVEESLGRHRRFGRNFLIGMTSSALVVGFASAATWSPCEGWCFVHPNSSTDAFFWGLAGGAVIVGIPVGMLLGIVLKHERWGPVALPGVDSPVRLTPVLGPRPGVAVTIPLRAF